MGDSDQEKVIATLKAYLKLCAKPSHRPLILKDQTILHVLKSFLGDDRVVVMTYLVKILLYLSENPDDALVLSNVGGLEENLASAAEKSFPPNIVYNILIIVSRLKSAQDKAARNKRIINNPVSAPADESCIGGGGTISRKFVSRKSKQLIYEFDELWEELKNEIERRVLAKKGVISIYFNMTTNRATIRTVLNVDAQEITDLLFDCGCEMVTQVVKVDGVDELFKMYASEREKKVVKLPDYLDDLEVVDPNSCVVTNDYASARKDGGGWFNTLSSFMRGDVLVANQMQSMNIGSNGSDYINDLYRAYQDAETMYTETRSSRIRAAMFPESEAGPSSGIPHRATIIEQMSLPARVLKTAVLDLLSFEGTSDISLLPIPDLVDLMSDRDEVFIIFTVFWIFKCLCLKYLLRRFWPVLYNVSDNVNVKRDAIGALSHISEHPQGRMQIFRSGGLAELIRMLYCPVETVVQYAVTTLRNLLMHVDTVKAQARVLGAIEALAPLLLRNNWKFLALVADSLYFLLLDDPQSKIVFLSLGGPQTLVHILNNYSQYPKLMYTVIRCIRSLSVCQQNKAALISLGCLPALYKEMCTAADDRVLLAILVALRNLSDAATNEDNLAP
ncbi:Armadillo/beta-catenin-like repeat protein, partial [Cooperia oncophora]